MAARTTHAAHGSTRAYRLGCHCPDCTNAVRKDEGRRALLKATGRWQPFTDPTPARDHIAALLAAGLRREDIARAADTTCPTLDHIRRGDYGKIRTEIAHRILAVDPTRTSPDRYLLDATGTRRRLQALYWRGYSTEAILRLTGLASAKNVRDITRGASAHVERETRDAVADAYRRLADTDPAEHGVTSDAVHRARAYALRRGFAPAAAWDDDTIDDPAASPDLGAKTKRRDALAEDAEWIARTTGAGPDQIAERLGVTRNYLDKIHERVKAAA